MLPYSRQSIDQRDIDAVVDVLRSGWLTTGPTVEQFEKAVARHVAARHTVAFCNGTAALHAAVATLSLQPGDEVIVPAITFVATANAVVYCGGTPIFADVDPETLLLDPQDVVRKITSRTRAVIAMDYAGQTCDYPLLNQIACRNGLHLLADCCHSLGATSFGRHVPEWVPLACYSFHPVKPITTCEGGMVATDDERLATALRHFRNHGITTDHHQRSRTATCFYDMQSLGFNYRLSDVHSALGLAQLQRLAEWTRQRAVVAEWYRQQLRDLPWVRPLANVPGSGHAHHLFVVRWQAKRSGVDRDTVIQQLRERQIFANVHYRPVYQHTFYRQQSMHLRMPRCPQAEAVYEELISLPLFPAMSQDDVTRVVGELQCIVRDRGAGRRKRVA
jgi:perosamine synthetase